MPRVSLLFTDTSTGQRILTPTLSFNHFRSLARSSVFVHLSIRLLSPFQFVYSPIKQSSLIHCPSISTVPPSIPTVHSLSVSLTPSFSVGLSTSHIHCVSLCPRCAFAIPFLVRIRIVLYSYPFPAFLI